MFNKVLSALFSSALLVGSMWAAGENMLKNGDFSAGLKYWESSSRPAPGPRFSLDQGNLKWQSEAKSGYVITWQKVKGFKVGRFYELSGEVKCTNLVGAKESGATICLEFHGKNFREGFRYNAHPGGVRNTHEWQKISSMVGPIIPEIEWGSVGLYVRKNSVRKQFFRGEAWWRNIQLRQVPMRCQILQPAYKMNVQDKLELEFELWPQDWGKTAADWRLGVQIFPKRWGKIAKKACFNANFTPEKAQFIWQHPVKLPQGTYELVVTLADKSGQELWRCDYEIYKKDLSQATVKIDAHRRILLHNQPFFLLGIYNNAYTPEQFERAFKFITNSGLNTLVSYREMSFPQLDRYHQAHKKVILSVKDYFHKIWYCPGAISSPRNEIYPLAKTVKKYMKHPALLAWYTNDESGPELLDSHESHYEVINRLDDNHPAWNLHNTTAHLPLLANHCDMIGLDEYPLVKPQSKYLNLGKTLRSVYDEMRSGGQKVVNSRPLIAVLQCYDVYALLPTIGQIRNMSYQALAAGATGIVYYTLENDHTTRIPEHWQNFAELTRELAAKQNIFLSIEPASPVSVVGKNVVYFTRKYQKEHYLFLINLENSPTQVKITLPPGAKICQLERDGQRVPPESCRGGVGQLQPYEVVMVVFK